MANSILEVENLVKRYGDLEAVRGVSFAVEEGEVFGLLGPNGAGKTSTVEVLEGLRIPDGGRVSVCGLDPQRDSAALKHEIGAALQSTSLPDKLRVMEALRLFASFYKRRRNPEELLKRFGLEEKRNTFYNQLSGGQKQRLALAMALVNDPKVLFFDEPTAGLDPQVRREIYDIIEELKREKKTIVMTTHYIEEAERLCDRVAIVDHGHLIALGTPAELIARLETRNIVEFTSEPPLPASACANLPGCHGIARHGEAWQLRVDSLAEAVPHVIDVIEKNGAKLLTLSTHEATLEDLFVSLTGRELRDN